MAIPGPVGLAIKIALLTGLRSEEILYIHRQEACNVQSCDCSNLHIIDGQNGLSVVIINWFHDKQRCYLTMLPTRLLESFRTFVSVNEHDLANAEKAVMQSAGIDFDELREIFFCVMRSTMMAREFAVLTGKATPEAARDCITYKRDSMANQYCKAWEKFGVILPVI